MNSENQVTPDDKYHGMPLVTVTLYQCQHCGQVAQHPKDVPHLGCAKDSEFGAHKDASYLPLRVQVQIINDA